MSNSPNSLNMSQAMQFADGMAELDRHQEKLREGRATDIELDSILDRDIDSRKLDKDNVASLLESISALGLIEPIVVDLEYRLLAGAHRLAAIRKLKSSRPELFAEWFPGGLVPVRIMSVNARLDPEAALGIEVAENAQRRNYSLEEIDKLAKRLIAIGYRDAEGKPREGEKRLLPAIAAVIRKSTRTVRRHMRELRASGSVASVPEGQTRPNGRVCRKVDERTYAVNAGRRMAEIIKHYEGLGQDASGIVLPLKAASEAIAALAKHLSNQMPIAKATE